MDLSTESQEQPLSFTDLGISRSRNIYSTFLGQRRSAESLSKLEWSFLILSFTSLSISMGFTIYDLATLSAKDDEFTFAIVLLVNLLFSILYVVDGIFREQCFEILAVVLTTFLVLTYVLLNFISKTNSVDHIKMVRLITAATLAPAVLVIGILLSRHYSQTGFLIFRTVGARQDLQNACQLLFLGQTLLAFDAQAMTSLLILVLKGGATSPSDEEKYTLIGGGILTALWLLLGYLAMRLENRRATIVFLMLSFGQPAFVIWRFCETHIQFSSLSVLYKSAFMAGVTMFLVDIALFITTIMVYKNYGKGLRQRVYETLSGMNCPEQK